MSQIQRARKTFLIKRVDCEEVKRSFGGKKSRIKVEEVERFCEIFLLARVACQAVWPYGPLSSVAITAANSIPIASLSH